MVSRIGYIVRAMKTPKLRKVLAARLAEWMAADLNLDTQQKVAATSNVGQTTISRILRCRVSATLDNIEAIAEAFGRQAFELIKTDQADDFAAGIPASLPAEEKGKITAFIEFTLHEYARRHDKMLSFIGDAEVAHPDKEQAARAAKRPVSGRTLSIDTQPARAAKRRRSRSKQ